MLQPIEVIEQEEKEKAEFAKLSGCTICSVEEAFCMSCGKGCICVFCHRDDKNCHKCKDKQTDKENLNNSNREAIQI